MRSHVLIVAGVIASECVDAVPGEVLAEFGMAGVVPVRLPGGQGTMWRAGRYHATSVRDITAASGLVPAALYNLFQ